MARKMIYKKDLSTSAKRHLEAAVQLTRMRCPGSQPGCNAVAGYLFGLAGELALKEMMRASGLKPNGPRQDDPFYAHFPVLKTLLGSVIYGRRAGQLRKFADSPSLFQNWATNMRYAPTSDIKIAWVKVWHINAKELVEAMDLP
jgi:hypothetical protein